MKLGFPQLKQMYSAILCFELWWESRRTLAGSPAPCYPRRNCSGHLNPSVLSAHLLEAGPGAHMVTSCSTAAITLLCLTKTWCSFLALGSGQPAKGLQS